MGPLRVWFLGPYFIACLRTTVSLHRFDQVENNIIQYYYYKRNVTRKYDSCRAWGRTGAHMICADSIRARAFSPSFHPAGAYHCLNRLERGEGRPLVDRDSCVSCR